MIEAIIFDMDGLLVDSERVWYIAEQELIRSHGHEFTLDVRNSIVGLRVDEFLERIRSVYNLEPDVPALAADLEARMLALIPREVRAQPARRRSSIMCRRRACRVPSRRVRR
jgi:beta-phosphoglucomutase-like phosphatase (HAD superfamily)